MDNEMLELSLTVRGSTQYDLDELFYHFVREYEENKKQKQGCRVENAGNFYFHITSWEERKGK